MPRLLGQHAAAVRWLSFEATYQSLASSDESGEVRIWSLEPGARTPVRTIQSGLDLGRGIKVDMDESGSTLVAGQIGPHTTTEVFSVWDLGDPPDADPLVLRHRETKLQDIAPAIRQASEKDTCWNGPERTKLVLGVGGVASSEQPPANAAKSSAAETRI